MLIAIHSIVGVFFSGWSSWQRHWIHNQLADKTGRYKSQQTPDESDALLSGGKIYLQIYRYRTF